MATLTFLVDEAGDLWNAASTDFHHRLGVRDPDFDVAAYAVKNFGWVEIGYGRRRMTVRLRPASVEPTAIKFLKDVLKGTDKSEIMLSAWVETWKRERYASPGDALARLGTLLGPADSRRNAKFEAVSVSVEQIFRDKQINLIEHLQVWRSLMGCVELPVAQRLAINARDGRTGLIERSAERGTYVMRHVGTALRFHSQESRQRLIGSDVRDAPDPEYAAWCSLAYDAAIASGEPVIQDVNARVRTSKGGLLFMTYRRIVTSVSTPSGSQLILVSSQPLQQQREAA